MSNQFNKDTPNQFEYYSKEDALLFTHFIKDIIKAAEEFANVPYSRKNFIKHAEINNTQVSNLLHSEDDAVAIPANILFWALRATRYTKVSCPVQLPHIYKERDALGERFFVVSREEWLMLKPNHYNEKWRLTDHAKLNYLVRVLGIKVDNLLRDIPLNKEPQSVKKLNDGRVELEIDGFLYIMDNDVCVTVLNKGMPTT